MLSLQLGSALSLGLASTVGPAGASWLRLSCGAVLVLAMTRPTFRGIRTRDFVAVWGLGTSTGIASIALLAAIQRIPFGTAVAITFLGPLTVSAASARTASSLLASATALTGVALLTRPWAGNADLFGLGLAGIAAIGWGGYILLTHKVGQHISGLTSLAFTLPIAAATAAVMGVPQALGHLTVGSVAMAAGLSLLVPVLPYALELTALRMMTPHAFGTLTALEPAIGVVLGVVVLDQPIALIQLLGLVLVVVAGGAAQHGGAQDGQRAIPPPR